MTLPDERTRALVWAGGFLIELARDKSLPLRVRQRAVWIARHFPTVEQISLMAAVILPSGVTLGLADPKELDEEPVLSKEFKWGLLSYSTRLAWPEEPPAKKKNN